MRVIAYFNEEGLIRIEDGNLVIVGQGGQRGATAPEIRVEVTPRPEPATVGTAVALDLTIVTADDAVHSSHANALPSVAEFLFAVVDALGDGGLTVNVPNLDTGGINRVVIPKASAQIEVLVPEGMHPDDLTARLSGLIPAWVEAQWPGLAHEVTVSPAERHVRPMVDVGPSAPLILAKIVNSLKAPGGTILVDGLIEGIEPYSWVYAKDVARLTQREAELLEKSGAKGLLNDQHGADPMGAIFYPSVANWAKTVLDVRLPKGSDYREVFARIKEHVMLVGAEWPELSKLEVDLYAGMATWVQDPTHPLVDQVTVYRWVQRFTPLLADAARFTRHSPGDRWFVDETYVKVNGLWRYVYRAVDQHGQVIDVLLATRRDLAAARRFFTRALRTLRVMPREVLTDAAPVYPAVLDELLPSAWHHVEQYENNPIEADHGQLKRRLRPMRGLQTDRTAQVVIAGHAFMQNLRRGHYDLALDAPPATRLAAAFTSWPKLSDQVRLRASSRPPNR